MIIVDYYTYISNWPNFFQSKEVKNEWKEDYSCQITQNWNGSHEPNRCNIHVESICNKICALKHDSPGTSNIPWKKLFFNNVSILVKNLLILGAQTNVCQFYHIEHIFQYFWNLYEKIKNIIPIWKN